MFEPIVFIAFVWGAFSAVSLPLGSWLGLKWNPGQKINSAFMAYGAGALLFALTIELFAHVPHHVDQHGTWAFFAVVGGALAGGLFFDLLNNMLNNRGAFIRKFSSAKRYVANIKMKRAKKMLAKMGVIPAFRVLPPEKAVALFQHLEEEVNENGEPVFRQGDDPAAMYFIISGEIDIIVHDDEGEKKVATLGPGEVFGEAGIITGAPRSADAVPRGKVRMYKLSREAFNSFSSEIPEFAEKLKKLSRERLNELSEIKNDELDKQMMEWLEETVDYMDSKTQSVTMEEVHKEVKHSGGASAALAIWLGILIDGIPESLIIGILAMDPRGMSTAFIAGVFLANMPEAMSSSVTMAKGGMGRGKILLLWGSLCLMTGVGAGIGAFIFPLHPEGWYLIFIMVFEGLAAGAMLTMIAETMLPEAFEQGGSIVGMATLLGFLSALVIKVFG